MQTSRRSILSAGLVTGSAAALATVSLPDVRATAAAPPLSAYPFTLGIASGDPAPDGFVIWTRLAPSPLDDDGLGGMPSRRYPVEWEIARDEQFRKVVRRGSEPAGPESAHAVHAEVRGLESGREYFYRFRIERWLSPVGRSVTAPRPGSQVAAMTMGFISCSNFPAGYFTAYRHLADERPDLILHLGDYQYEGGAGSTPNPLGRAHLGPETRTLANYRQRQAQYKTDPDLQLAHAAAPWLPVWDDHELENNYADEVPEREADVPGFRERRAAAYRAYYENMPLRRTSVPRGPDMQLFRRVSWGNLATFHMLDTRQYRDDQSCGDGYDDCPEAADPARSLPGLDQERWLLDGFRRSRARWDLLGQQVFFGRRDNDAGAANTVSMDSWDGYPASRDRVVQGWLGAGVRNPVVLTGDVHAHWASDVLADWTDPTSEVLGSELITSSITSGGDGYDSATGQHPWAAWNPNLRFWTNLRGYVRTTITPDELTADFRCVPAVTTQNAEVFTRATFVVEDGVRGLQQTADNPLPARSDARQALPSDAQIIEDTIREETGG
jgi:alkaline phosphatase D